MYLHKDTKRVCTASLRSNLNFHQEKIITLVPYELFDITMVTIKALHPPSKTPVENPGFVTYEIFEGMRDNSIN